jgi:hypothetical protein
VSSSSPHPSVRCTATTVSANSLARLAGEPAEASQFDDARIVVSLHRDRQPRVGAVARL